MSFFKEVSPTLLTRSLKIACVLVRYLPVAMLSMGVLVLVEDLRFLLDLVVRVFLDLVVLVVFFVFFVFFVVDLVDLVDGFVVVFLIVFCL